MFLRGIGDHAVGQPAMPAEDMPVSDVQGAGVRKVGQPNWLQRLMQWLSHFGGVRPQDARR
jgi:hypothetical protein